MNAGVCGASQQPSNVGSHTVPASVGSGRTASLERPRGALKFGHWVGDECRVWAVDGVVSGARGLTSGVAAWHLL